VAATSYPANLPAAQFRPHGFAPRKEWLAYSSLVGQISVGSVKPSYGDYGVSHPDTESIDPRMMDPNAKIKYTLNDDWLVFTGQQVKRFGREQYRDLCGAVVASAHFSGEGFSWGDKYIADCAAGLGTTGGSSTWPSVATNHHVTTLVDQLANLHGI
jgi:hypothetical protein